MMHQNPDHTAVAGAFEVGTITIPHFVHVVQAYRERRGGGVLPYYTIHGLNQ